MKEESEIQEFNSFLVNLGNFIKVKREGQKLTQEQVSEITGIEYKYYQKIEGGKVNFTFKTFHKICITLNVDIIKFLK